MNYENEMIAEVLRDIELENEEISSMELNPNYWYGCN